MPIILKSGRCVSERIMGLIQDPGSQWRTSRLGFFVIEKKKEKKPNTSGTVQRVKKVVLSVPRVTCNFHYSCTKPCQ